MRMLHTSDWHLGASSGPVSRLPEQQVFLDWLLQTLTAHEIDTLVVAGDVFDVMHPPTDAVATYFRFLARLPATGVRDVVVIGGNHDSPSQLDAPRHVLEALSVSVVGGLPPAGDRGSRMIVPLRSRGGRDVIAVCAAVPYVHEYRLGVRTTDTDKAALRDAFQTAFRDLYRSLVDEAEQRYPGVPIVTTGHLALGTGSSREDYPLEVHQVGTLDGLSVEIFDERIRYAALGHIHRAYPVRGSVARYSGSPLPYSRREMSTPRVVLMVELTDGHPVEVTPVPVPLQRELRFLGGDRDEVIEAYAGLHWATPLPPLVHVAASVLAPDRNLRENLQSVWAKQAQRPELVEIRQVQATPSVPSSEGQPWQHRTLSPGEVFDLLCDVKNTPPELRAKLKSAFSELVSASDEDFADMVAAVEPSLVEPSSS